MNGMERDSATSDPTVDFPLRPSASVLQLEALVDWDETAGTTAYQDAGPYLRELSVAYPAA